MSYWAPGMGGGERSDCPLENAMVRKQSRTDGEQPHTFFVCCRYSSVSLIVSSQSSCDSLYDTWAVWKIFPSILLLPLSKFSIFFSKFVASLPRGSKFPMMLPPRHIYQTGGECREKLLGSSRWSRSPFDHPPTTLLGIFRVNRAHKCSRRDLSRHPGKMCQTRTGTLPPTPSSTPCRGRVNILLDNERGPGHWASEMDSRRCQETLSHSGASSPSRRWS